MTKEEINRLLTDYTETKKAVSFYKSINNDACNDRARGASEKMQKYEELLKGMFALVSNDTHREMLTDYYINGLLWRQVSAKYHYSEFSIYNTKDRALQEIARKVKI